MGKIPVCGMMVLLGIDRFMSEARAITNTVGNAVRMPAIGCWVDAVDGRRLAQVLDGSRDPTDSIGPFAENDEGLPMVQPVRPPHGVRAA